MSGRESAYMWEARCEDLESALRDLEAKLKVACGALSNISDSNSSPWDSIDSVAVAREALAAIRGDK